MKTSRQVAILEIIENERIDTQEGLAKALQQRGYQVTQATVSRDIKELRLIKVLTDGGGYRYAVAEHNDSDMTERFVRLLSECVLSVASAGHIVVIKTLNGSANAACEALDSLRWPEVIGTLAGDNTIMMIIRTGSEVASVEDRIRAMIR